MADLLSTSELLAQRFRLGREVGRGGLGVVFEAFDERDQRNVALKRLANTGDKAAQEHRQALIRREYAILAQFAHPNVVHVYDFALDHGVPFYTMELVQGMHPGASGPMPWRDVCRMLITLCEPLALLHARGWVHRDLAPRNVYLATDGTPKLLDFGAIAEIDAPHRAVGTPPCVAPETLYRQRIDARTDLFGLGALGYAALTAQHAYPARALAQLPLLWQTPLVKPSILVPDIPDSVDELIAWLLSLDIHARPRQVVEVVQRLAAAANLRIDAEGPSTRAILNLPTLVGRTAEITRMHELLRSSEAERGASCVVRAASGAGASRLIDHLGLEARLRGHAVLRANANRSRAGSFALVRELYGMFAATEPELTRTAATALESSLALFAQDLESEARSVEAQRAFIAFCERLSTLRPVLLIVHHFDEADPQSAKLLAQLARRAPDLRLSIAVSLRPTDATSSEPIRAILGDAIVVELAPLSAADAEKLLCALFGDVPNVARVAQIIHRTSGGQPGAMVAAARGLVDTGLAKFGAAGWQLPAYLDPPLLTTLDMQAALDRQLDALSPHARELLQLLASATRPYPCDTPRYRRALGQPEAALIKAEGELFANHSLALNSNGYTVPDPTLLLRVRARMTPLEVESAHDRLAEFYLAERLDLCAAYHLWQGGRLDEAEATLDAALAAREENRDGGVLDAFARSAEAHDLYQRALTRCEHVHAAPARLYRLRSALLSSGHPPYEQTNRLAAEMMAQLRLDIGLDFAAESPAQDAMGRIVFCLQAAQQRHESQPEAERGLPPGEAILAIARAVALLSGVYALQYDAPRLRLLADLICPLRTLAPGLDLAAEMAELAAVSIAASSDVSARRIRVIELTRNDVPGVSPNVRELVHYFSSYYLALEYATEARPAALAIAEMLESKPEFEALGIQVRRTHALARGDLATAQRLRRSRELLSFQSAISDGHLQMSLLREIGAANDCRDLLEAIRHTAAIRERAAKYPGWQPWAALGQALCSLLADEPAAAALVAEEANRGSLPFAHGAWQHLITAEADALNDLQRYAEARGLMLHVFTEAEQRGLVIDKWRFMRATLCIAEAGLGMREQAISQLDRLLANTADELGTDNVIYGRLCEARCNVGYLLDDYSGFAKHLELLKPRYANHPSLRARHARWVRAGQERFRVLIELLSRAKSRDSNWASQLVQELPRYAVEHQGSYLLALLLDELEVDTGQLFRVDDTGGLQLVAARPAVPERRMLEAAQVYHQSWSASDDRTTADKEDGDASGPSYVPLWLTKHHRPDQLAGLVLLACPIEKLEQLPPGFVRALALHLETLAG